MKEILDKTQKRTVNSKKRILRRRFRMIVCLAVLMAISILGYLQFGRDVEVCSSNPKIFSNGSLEEISIIANKLYIFDQEKFARYVALSMENIKTPFSNNYFDIMAGGRAEITIPVGKMKEQEVLEKLRIKSVANIDSKGNVVRDIAKNTGVLLAPKNIKDVVLKCLNIIKVPNLFRHFCCEQNHVSCT